MIGQRLKEIRLKRNLTQQQASDLCEVKLSSWRKWEQGKVEPNGGTLKRICKELNCTADYLIGVDEFNDRDVKRSARLESYLDKLSQMYNDEVNRNVEVAAIEIKYKNLSPNDQKLVEEIIDRLVILNGNSDLDRE